MTTPRVKRSFDEPHIHLTCRCGWQGYDDDVRDWDVQVERDRVVRCCPSCGDPVPEWGTLPSVDGATCVGRGTLADALDDADDI